jgi:DNA-binding MarR family transcriptional regulator
VGLQGTGKSTALQILCESLGDERIFLWKWGKDFIERLRGESNLQENWERAVYQELSDKPDKFIEEKLRIASVAFRGSVADLREPSRREEALQELRKIVPLEYAEKLVGAEVIERLKDAFLWNDLRQTRFIFIDLPDYKKTDAYSFSKDLDYIQHLWDKLMHETITFKKENGKIVSQPLGTTFLVAFQKELVMKKPHFFLGKMDIVELKPLRADELVRAYEQRWKTIDPFTADSLKYLAELSRGVFRRFLKYIQTSIEKLVVDSKTPPISVEDVKATISSDMLLTDMELELSDLFTQHTQKVQAVKILTTLREGPLNQKQIASLIGVSEATAGRLISKLEAYDYIQRIRGEGRTLLISLKLAS